MHHSASLGDFRLRLVTGIPCLHLLNFNKEEDKFIELKLIENKGLKRIIIEGVSNDRLLTSKEFIMKFNELHEEIELTNYECVDNKTVFIVSRTYKGKRNLKDIISQRLLEEINAQNDGVYDDNVV